MAESAQTTSDPHGLHDWHSKSYVDEWIDNDVTRDDERRPYLERLAQLLPFREKAAPRVLDVGSGYAMLSRAVIDTWPACTVVLHDFSLPMADRARERLSDALDRISFVTSDLREPSWVDAVGGPFDAVVSSLAIHNVRTSERIKQIYAEIRTVVAPGGCFYNIDHVQPAGPLTSSALWGGRRRSREGRPQPTEVADLEHHLRWLREGGFDEADCLLRDGSQTIVAGFVAEG